MHFGRQTGGEGASTMSERLGMQRTTPSVSEQGMEMIQDQTRIASYTKAVGTQLSRTQAGLAGQYTITP